MLLVAAATVAAAVTVSFHAIKMNGNDHLLETYQVIVTSITYLKSSLIHLIFAFLPALPMFSHSYSFENWIQFLLM